MRESVILSWSGGKDSALALYELSLSAELEVVGLLTTVTADHVSMHGVPRALLERQTRSLGLPVTEVEIPPAPSDAEYGARLTAALEEMHDRGIRAVAFGDLFLEDIRRYREELLAPLDMRALFPLWGRDTTDLAREFLSLGFRAVTVCVDSRAIDGAFAGRSYDESFLRDLPSGTDPCGENGEFHTFVHDGPGFAEPVGLRAGKPFPRDERFWVSDLSGEER